MRQEVVQEAFYVRSLVSESGYEWLDGDDGKRRLVPKGVEGSGFRRCPLVPGAFLEFAALNGNEDEIRSFANQYGPLSESFSTHQTATRKDKTVALGDTPGTWKQEAADMAALVRLWRMVAHRDIKGLKQLIMWSKASISYELRTPRRTSSQVIAHDSASGSTEFQRYRRGDVLLPGKEALRLETNKRLAEYPPEAVLLRTTEGSHRLVMSARNLLAALWLQFAQATVGEFELYPCEACGRFFQRGPGGRRADATTCGDACRQRLSRLRRSSK